MEADDVNNTIKFNARKTKLIAHRGLSGLEKENTCAAFVAAGNRSYYGIETDIHKTGDGNFIIIHDSTTIRVAGDNVNVEETTYETLRQIRLLNRGGIKDRADLHLPSLEEYISICKQYEKIAVLELKTDFTPEQIREIIDRIEALDYIDGVVFISFIYDTLLKVREYRPNQRCQWLQGKMTERDICRLAADKIDVDICWTDLTKKKVEMIHKKGLEVNCWTVDNPETAEMLASWGVDYITSNILEAE